MDERPGPDHLVGHASEGSAALGQVHDHQSDEHEPHDGVVGDPHVQELQCAECGGGRGQQTEMDREAGSGAPRAPAGPATIRSLAASTPGTERRVNHRSPAGPPLWALAVAMFRRDLGLGSLDRLVRHGRGFAAGEAASRRTAAKTGMPTRMRRRSATGTFPSAAIPPFSELLRSHPIMPM